MRKSLRLLAKVSTAVAANFRVEKGKILLNLTMI